MYCIKCHQKIPPAPFCNLCGWDQAKPPISTTVSNIYTLFKRRHFRKLSDKGRAGYENAWRFISPFSDLPISSISLEQWQSVIDGQSHRSRSHQEKIQQLISQLCKQAMLVGCLNFNLAPFLELDGYKGEPYTLFNDKEIQLLFQTAALPSTLGETARTILILIFTGWRPEELFSIKLDQVHLDHRYFVSGSKTKAGKNRTMPIAPNIFPYVVAFYYRSTQGEYLIRSPSGKRINLQNWRNRRFYPCLLELGINTPDAPNRIKPYSTRHTFATLAYRAGVKKELLIKLMGHTNFLFTMETYIHNQVDELAAETNKISFYFNNLFESEECI